MDSTPLSSRSPSPHSELTHSVGEVLRERAGIPERAPRIKIGDQYYHVVRIVGGHYEAPIAEVESLVKTGAIGESFFSAHKKYAEATPALQGQKILYANDEGVHYENGMLVRNVDVHLDTEDTTNYLKATDNFAWQQEVKDYEQHLNTLTPTDSISRVPPYLHRIATRGRNHGPYTPQQVKGFLLEYTKDKLLAAHEVFVKRHHDPERHREDLERAIDREIDLMQSPTQVINHRNDYFKAYLTTDHLWKMMVDTLQPGEFRLLPEEEALDHTGLPFVNSEPIDIPRFVAEEEDHGRHSVGSSPSPLHPKSPILRPTPPVRPRSTEPVSLLTQELEAHRRRQESLSPSLTPSRSPSPTHVPPLHLGRSHQSSFHPHPVAVEVHRTDTLPPETSHIPLIEKGREVHSPSPSLIDEWEEIDLSSRPGSPGPGVIVPFVDPHASQSVGRRSLSPFPRSIQQSSMRRPPRKLEFFEQEDFRARAELYPQLRLIASNAPQHEWESRAATKAACRSAHQKMERNAEPEEYTTSERHAIHQVIQKQEAASGFGLLMTGSKYQSVSKSLAFYANIGLI